MRFGELKAAGCHEGPISWRPLRPRWCRNPPRPRARRHLNPPRLDRRLSRAGVLRARGGVEARSPARACRRCCGVRKPMTYQSHHPTWRGRARTTRRIQSERRGIVVAGSTFQTHPIDLNKLLDDCHRGSLQLPDFQRSWVWDEDRIKSLIASVSRAFPVGALMSLDTGGPVNFKPRPVEGAPAEAKQIVSAIAFA